MDPARFDDPKAVTALGALHVLAQQSTEKPVLRVTPNYDRGPTDESRTTPVPIVSHVRTPDPDPGPGSRSTPDQELNTRQKRVVAAAEAHLQSDENVSVVIAGAVSRFWAHLFLLVAPFGILVYLLALRRHAVVVSDRQVLVLRSSISSKPQRLEAAFDRHDLHAEARRGWLWHQLLLNNPPRSMRLYVGRGEAAQWETAAASLGAPLPAPSAPLGPRLGVAATVAATILAFFFLFPPNSPRGSTTGSTTDELQLIADDCAANNMAACDDLYSRAETGSELEAFGASCGERILEDIPGGRCVAQFELANFFDVISNSGDKCTPIDPQNVIKAAWRCDLSYSGANVFAFFLAFRTTIEMEEYIGGPSPLFSGDTFSIIRDTRWSDSDGMDRGRYYLFEGENGGGFLQWSYDDQLFVGVAELPSPDLAEEWWNLEFAD